MLGGDHPATQLLRHDLQQELRAEYPDQAAADAAQGRSDHHHGEAGQRRGQCHGRDRRRVAGQHRPPHRTLVVPDQPTRHHRADAGADPAGREQQPERDAAALTDRERGARDRDARHLEPGEEEQQEGLLQRHRQHALVSPQVAHSVGVRTHASARRRRQAHRLAIRGAGALRRRVRHARQQDRGQPVGGGVDHERRLDAEHAGEQAADRGADRQQRRPGRRGERVCRAQHAAGGDLRQDRHPHRVEHAADAHLDRRQHEQQPHLVWSADQQEAQHHHGA